MTPSSVHTLCFFSAHPPPDILVRRPSPGGTEKTFPELAVCLDKEVIPKEAEFGGRHDV